jgi:hypothetical protein
MCIMVDGGGIIGCGGGDGCHGLQLAEVRWMRRARARMMMIMRACSVEKRQATLLSSGFIFFSLVGVA